MFTIDTEVRLLAKSEEVWPFFSNARNLERLTPGFLKFQVLTPDPIEMKEGTSIDYRLRIRGIPNSLTKPYNSVGPATQVCR
jgi:ligand-binding SRPBCC domain-containing protein